MAPQTQVQEDVATTPVATKQLTVRDTAVAKVCAAIADHPLVEDCSPEEAESMLVWLEGFIEGSRAQNYAWQYPTDEQMAGRDYEIFDAIMEHGAVASAGSAHEAVELAVLDPARGEKSLLHDQIDLDGSPAYCTLQVGVGVFG